MFRLDNSHELGKLASMYSHEEELTRIFFGRVAGRHLSDAEVKATVSDVKRTAEIIRSTNWLRRALREQDPKLH